MNKYLYVETINITTMALKCPVCGRSFKNRAGLIQHIRRSHPQHYRKAQQIANKLVAVRMQITKSKKGKPMLVITGNFDNDPAVEKIAIYLARARKRKKKGGTTAPARVFNF